MAGELDRAMGRLKHRDIRTRRRAVRTLVELEDPESQGVQVALGR